MLTECLAELTVEDKNVFPEVTFSVSDIRFGIFDLSFLGPEVRFSKPVVRVPFPDDTF